MKYSISILVTIILFSGCATMDRVLTPVDKKINKTKSIYNEIKYSVDESLNNLNKDVKDLELDIYESPIVKFFSNDKSIIKYRDKNLVKWSNTSEYNSKKLIQKYLLKNNIRLNENDLKVSDKMDILNKFFFDKLKHEYKNKFTKENKKITFDPFLTDRENVNKIYEYKTKLRLWEHQWNIDMHITQKKVAKLMLSTLFDTPRTKFISYDPYD